MKFGVTMFPTDYSIAPAELAQAVEERDFESLFFPEHTHIPTSRRTPWPGGADLPREYSHTLDPFVALASAAAATERLRIGTGICLVIERDPITLAKEVASLDFLSGGRFLFAIGGGWNLEEMENHGTDPAQRWKILRERILAMKSIWTEDESEYHGGPSRCRSPTRLSSWAAVGRTRSSESSSTGTAGCPSRVATRLPCRSA